MQKLLPLVATLVLCLGWSATGYCKSGSSNTTATVSDSKKNKNTVKKRERHIVRERVNKGSNNINFEDVDIDGQAKTPMNDIVNGGRDRKGHDFVKVRTRWHPEMIRSVTDLGYAGNGRRP